MNMKPERKRIKMDQLLNELLERYPALNVCAAEIAKAADLLEATARRDGTVLTCGNGGSCADADHIVGELMKGFLSKRPMDEAGKKAFREALGEDADLFTERLQRPIRAVSLTAQTAVLSAFANDVDPDLVYAQLTYGYAKKGDLLIGISTSGNAANVTAAAKVAKAAGAFTVALTGARESKLSAVCDVTIRVPETETFKVQELHLPVYHYLCAAVEQRLFG